LTEKLYFRTVFAYRHAEYVSLQALRSNARGFFVFAGQSIAHPKHYPLGLCPHPITLAGELSALTEPYQQHTPTLR